MSETKFAHVGLNCRDMEETERYYVKHFGFRRARVVPLGNAKIVFLKSDKAYLELFAAEGPEVPDPVKGDGPAAAGFRHMAFQVADVKAKLAEMGADAVVTLGPLFFDDFIKGWGAAWIRDPDGRILEISQGYKDEANPPAPGA